MGKRARKNDPGRATRRDRVNIRQLRTGVPGLDEILGGGLPEYSFNIIAGSPGGGKTTLAQQLVFAHASPERPALCFTVLGEPPLKMLRYQQQFDFFDFLCTEVRVLHGGIGPGAAHELAGELRAHKGRQKH